MTKGDNVELRGEVDAIFSTERVVDMGQAALGAINPGGETYGFGKDDFPPLTLDVVEMIGRLGDFKYAIGIAGMLSYGQDRLRHVADSLNEARRSGDPKALFEARISIAIVTDMLHYDLMAGTDGRIPESVNGAPNPADRRISPHVANLVDALDRNTLGLVVAAVVDCLMQGFDDQEGQKATLAFLDHLPDPRVQ